MLAHALASRRQLLVGALLRALANVLALRDLGAANKLFSQKRPSNCDTPAVVVEANANDLM